MAKLKTINFIQSHKNWKELLQAPPYCLKISEDEHYVLLQYNQIESDFSQQICRECRGLIVDKHTLKPKALSFFKFRNYGEEGAAKIHWRSARVQEKVDGSKILVWYNEYTKNWQISTSGCINAYTTKVGGFNFTFGQLFEEAICKMGFIWEHFFLYLNCNYCYTFELVSPYNRVVVHYPETKAYLIGMRNLETFEEEEPVIEHLDFPRPKLFSELDSLELCIAATDVMSADEEGFVVVDKFWNRVKIKSREYLQAHFVANNGVITPRRIWDILMQGEQNEFLSYFPEYKPEFDKVHSTIDEWRENNHNAIIEVFGKGFADQKELAAYVMQNHPDKRDVLFSFLKQIDLWLDLYLRKMTSTQRDTLLKL